MSAFIDAHPHFGVEPVCRALGARPGTHHERKTRPPSKRQVRDGELKTEIRRVFDQNRKVYGFRKVVKQLKREGVDISWCRVRRLMNEMASKACDVARNTAQPGLIRKRLVQQTSLIATSRQHDRISCGSPTSPM